MTKWNWWLQRITRFAIGASLFYGGAELALAADGWDWRFAVGTSLIVGGMSVVQGAICQRRDRSSPGGW